MVAPSRPDVYVEETLYQNQSSQLGPATPTAAFIGTAPRGFLTPKLVSNWSEYVRWYGGFDASSTLPLSVYTYFSNGGTPCWVVRVLEATSTTSTTTFGDDGYAATLKIDAISPGTWGDTVYIDMIDRDAASGRFDIIVKLGGTADSNIVERWLDLSMDSTDTRYVEAIINSETRGSAFITVADQSSASSGALSAPSSVSGEQLGATAADEVVTLTIDATGGTFDLNITTPKGTAALTTQAYDIAAATLQTNLEATAAFESGDVAVTGGPGASAPLVLTMGGDFANKPEVATSISTVATSLTGGASTAVAAVTTEGAYTGTAGSNGATIDDADYGLAIDSLDEVQDPLLINTCGTNAIDTPNGYAILLDAVQYASGRGDSFVVADVDASRTVAQAVTDAATVQAGLSSSQPSYVGLYYPRVKIYDPSAVRSGVEITVPVGPMVAARMITTDLERGPWKTPAGVDTRLGGVVGLETNPSVTDLGTLNDAYVNAIRRWPGGGISVMGGRTLKTVGTDRFISVRRALIYIKDSLTELTRFALFESNDQQLWNTLELTCTNFLRQMWTEGGLRGDSQPEAFFVKCDEEINTADRIENGEVHIQIGVALQYPAEFIIINIGQWDGGSTADEEVV